MHLAIALVRIVVALPVSAVPPADRQPPSQIPNPYVTVYHDEATIFQIRRDPITRLADDAYRVWLRWLWAMPQELSSGVESARMIVADLDCKGIRVRETRVLHKSHDGTVFAVEDTRPDALRWKSFPEDSGAASALRRVCQFIPGLIAGKSGAPGP